MISSYAALVSEKNAIAINGWDTRVVSTIHAIISTFIAGMCLQMEYNWNVLVLAEEPERLEGFSGPMIFSLAVLLCVN